MAGKHFESEGIIRGVLFVAGHTEEHKDSIARSIIQGVIILMELTVQDNDLFVLDLDVSFQVVTFWVPVLKARPVGMNISLINCLHVIHRPCLLSFK
jgi:hypothetical protein